MLRIGGMMLLLAMVSGLSATEVEISAGSEQFLWEEFADSGDKLLDETGLRHFVAIRGINHFDPLWSTSFSGRFYSGVVDFDGQTRQGGPAQGKVDYLGMRFEIGLSRRIGLIAMQPGASQWWLDFVLGNDFWRRHLRDTTLNDGVTSVSGYSEYYSSLYGRLGSRYQSSGGLRAGLGAKLPFHTDEQIKYAGQTISLNPQGRLSVYADLGYDFNPAWGITLAYDSYRFAKSDTVSVGSDIVWQPESIQDTLALSMHYRF
jgi:hypothetical protein